MDFLNTNQRFLDQQALNNDFERLVQESPVPKLLHLEPSNVQYSNRSFISPCPLTVRNTSLSAIPKSNFTNVSPLMPFRSPQTLLRGQQGANQSIAEVFKSLKNDSLNESGSSVKENESLTENNNNEQIVGNKIQWRNLNSHPLKVHQISNRLNSNETYRANNGGYLDKFKQYVERSNQRPDDVVEEFEITSQSTSTNQSHGDIGLNEDEAEEADEYEETFQEAFGDKFGQKNGNYQNSANMIEENDDSQDNEDMLESQEPCSLYMWIIKPVPGTTDICVEGKKSLSDENFWHSGVITRRLNEKVIATESGSVYRLEGNMELLDAMSAGFSHSTAEAFWLGFPQDWKMVIHNHFRRIISTREGHEKSTVVEDADIVVLDEEEMLGAPTEDPGLEEEDNSDDKTATGGDVDNELANDTADEAETLMDTEIDEFTVTEVDPLTCYRETASKKKDHVLSKWILRPLPGNQGVYVLGLTKDGLLWHSSAIERRLEQRRLLSHTGGIYRLKGNMDKLLAIDEGIPTEIINKFRTGFPKDWQEVVQEYFIMGNQSNKKVNSKSKEESNSKLKWTEKVQPNLKSKPAKPNCVKEKKNNISKNKSSEKKLSLSVKKSSNNKKSVNGDTPKQVLKQKEKNEKTPANKVKIEKMTTEVVSDNEQSKKLVVTPRGEVVDIDTLGCSRSGRLIKPPLQWWTGQTLRMDGEGIVIRAPTAYANRYLQEYEDGFKNSTRKICPYWNPSLKDNSSFNLSRSSSLNVSQSSISSTETIGSRRSVEKNVSKISKAKKGKTVKNCDIENDRKNLDDSFPKLENEITNILRKAKNNLENKRTKQNTCYNNKLRNGRQNTSTGGDSSQTDEYSFDDTADGTDAVRKVVGDKNSGNKHQKIAGKKRVVKGNGRVAEQENVVSSSTGEIAAENCEKVSDEKPEVRKTRSRNATATNNKTMPVLNKGRVMADFSVRSTRSGRLVKKLPIICEDEYTAEDSDVVEKLDDTRKQKKRRSTRKKSLPEQMEADDATAVAEDHWTKEEMEKLYRACKAVPPSHLQYWQKVSDDVRTKSPEACKEKYYKTKEKPPSARKNKQEDTKVKPKVTSLTANVGTLKRKQQLRDMLEQHNANHDDDIFDSTPYRQTRKRKMAKLDDMDDAAVFEELARKQGKNRFETPVATGSTQGRICLPFASEKKTPASSLNVGVMEDNPDMDGYLHKILKRRLLTRGSRKCAETPKPSKKAVVTAKCDSPKTKLFHEIINENENIADNNVDSDQEADYYWDEETAQ